MRNTHSECNYFLQSVQWIEFLYGRSVGDPRTTLARYILQWYCYILLLQRHSYGILDRVDDATTYERDLQRHTGKEGVKRRERRSLQTGSTSCGVSLSQTNGLRLFDAVFHRNLLFIIPQPLDDIGPCLPRVALMSLIAPLVRLPTTGSRYRDKTSGTSFSLSLSSPLLAFYIHTVIVHRSSFLLRLSRSPVLFSDRRAFQVKLSSLPVPYLPHLFLPNVGVTVFWKWRTSLTIYYLAANVDLFVRFVLRDLYRELRSWQQNSNLHMKILTRLL